MFISVERGSVDTVGAFAARALAGGAGAVVPPTDGSGGVDAPGLARGGTDAEAGALVIGGAAVVESGVPVDAVPVVPTLSGVVVPIVDPVVVGAAVDPAAVDPLVVDPVVVGVVVDPVVVDPLAVDPVVVGVVVDPVVVDESVAVVPVAAVPAVPAGDVVPPSVVPVDAPVAVVVVMVLPGVSGDVTGGFAGGAGVAAGVVFGGWALVPVVLVCAAVGATAIGVLIAAFAGSGVRAALRAGVRDAFVTGSATNVTPATSDFLLGSGSFGIRTTAEGRSRSRVLDTCATAGVRSGSRVGDAVVTAGFFSASTATAVAGAGVFLSATPKVAGVDGFFCSDAA